MAVLHSERFVKIVRITRFCANVCGADVFDANYRVNIRTAFVLTVIGSSFVFLAYTMIDGYAKEGDWTIIVQVLALAGGTLLQGFCVFLTFIKEQENLRFLLTECYDIYEKYERMDSDYRVYLDRGVRLLAKLMKLSAFINAMLVFGMSSFTFLYNFIYGTKATIVYAFAPGLDVATPVGFWATNFIQAGFIAVGGFGLYSGDMSVLTPISQIPTFQGILQCKFREINQLLDDDYESAEERGIKTMAALKDILEFHQKYLM